MGEPTEAPPERRLLRESGLEIILSCMLTPCTGTAAVDSEETSSPIKSLSTAMDGGEGA